MDGTLGSGRIRVENVHLIVFCHEKEEHKVLYEVMYVKKVNKKEEHFKNMKLLSV